LLAAAESQVWPETIPTELPKAKFPALPKPASQAVSAPRIHDEPPPLRLRPSEKCVVLRAANPDDRASSVAAADDFTGRRLASRARKIADERYRERARLRQADAAPALHRQMGQRQLQYVVPVSGAIPPSSCLRSTAWLMLHGNQ